MGSGLSIRQGASTATDSAEAAAELAAAIAQPDIVLAIVYCSSRHDLPTLARELERHLGSAPVIGCTTAGEITPIGYLQGSLTGVSIASPELRAVTTHITAISSLDFSRGEGIARIALAALEQGGRAAHSENTFGFLLIDGLAMKEELVVSALHRHMGDIRLFGGSAGDDSRLHATHVYYQGAFHADSALFTLIQTEHPFEVFKTQHFTSTAHKMVVTGADTAARRVTELNGMSPGQAYARLIGLEVEDLRPRVFAAHPVMVRLGGQDYVRSIREINPDESLTFHCAIDEGIVLTLARPLDLVQNLRDLFAGIRSRIGPPQLVLGCDCILRTIEMEQEEIKDEVFDILRENRVIGFSSYGEQYQAIHVNQTFTGVAIGSGRWVGA